MYNWDSSWNWSTKSLSSPSLLVLFPQLFHFLITVLCVCSYLCLKTLTEDFLNFLSSISSVCLSSSCVILWLRFLYSVPVFISSWCYACILLCLLLSTYSAASSSSLRNFLTDKFLSEELHKNRLFTPTPVDITHFQLVSEQGTPFLCVILV